MRHQHRMLLFLWIMARYGLCINTTAIESSILPPTTRPPLGSEPDETSTLAFVNTVTEQTNTDTGIPSNTVAPTFVNTITEDVSTPGTTEASSNRGVNAITSTLSINTGPTPSPSASTQTAPQNSISTETTTEIATLSSTFENSQGPPGTRADSESAGSGSPINTSNGSETSLIPGSSETHSASVSADARVTSATGSSSVTSTSAGTTPAPGDATSGSARYYGELFVAQIAFFASIVWYF